MRLKAAEEEVTSVIVTDPTDRAEKAATMAMQAMHRLGVPPVPTNYLLWYSHFTDRNPDLSRTLREIEASGERLTPARCDELYEQFFGRQRTARMIDDSCEQINEAMGRLLDRTGGLKRDSGQYRQDLQDFDQSLSATSDRAELHILVGRVLAATESMRCSVSELEDECSDVTARIGELQARLGRAEREANTDPLTGIANRRHLDACLYEATMQARTGEEPLSFLLLDLDHFKSLNDTFGHQVGDRVLKLMGQILVDSLKGRDLPARFGGEEFAVILPQTDLDGAQQIAEQIRSTVGRSRFRLKSSGRRLDQVTVSVGCSEYVPGEPVAALVSRADRALYRAKRAGRNRIVVAEAEDGFDGIVAA